MYTTTVVMDQKSTSEAPAAIVTKPRLTIAHNVIRVMMTVNIIESDSDFSLKNKRIAGTARIHMMAMLIK